MDSQSKHWAALLWMVIELLASYGWSAIEHGKNPYAVVHVLCIPF